VPGKIDTAVQEDPHVVTVMRSRSRIMRWAGHTE